MKSKAGFFHKGHDMISKGQFVYSHDECHHQIREYKTEKSLCHSFIFAIVPGDREDNTWCNSDLCKPDVEQYITNTGVYLGYGFDKQEVRVQDGYTWMLLDSDIVKKDL